MVNLTISDLKNELVNHGVELPASSAKKEDYVLLYETNIGEKSKIEFSSDDEEVTIPVVGKVSKKASSKRVSRKSQVSSVNGNADCNGEDVLTEENSLVVGNIDVAMLTDEDLATKLKEFNITVGPIVGKKISLNTQEYILHHKN